MRNVAAGIFVTGLVVAGIVERTQTQQATKGSHPVAVYHRTRDPRAPGKAFGPYPRPGDEDYEEFRAVHEHVKVYRGKGSR